MLLVVCGSIYGTGAALRDELLPTKNQFDDATAENAVICRTGKTMFDELNTPIPFWRAVGRYVVPSFCTSGYTRGLKTELLV